VAAGVVTVGAGTFIAVNVLTGGGGPTGLDAACRGGVTGDVSSTQVACSTALPKSGKNKRIQVIDLASPAEVPLKFSFCNGISCGDADPECYSNKWIPSFADKVPVSVQIPVPDGLRPSRVTLGAGGSSAAGGFDRHDVSWNSGGGSINVSLRSIVGHELTHVLQQTDGKVCGISEEEHQKFVDDQGDTLKNQTRSVRIVVEWEGADTTPLPNTVRINNTSNVNLP
jgi:hypothetical protein